jgi:YVTN family beta-propeller protein
MFCEGESMRAIRRSSLLFLLVTSFFLPVQPLFGQSGSVQATLTVGRNPVALSVNPASNKIYVANQSDDDISVIDGNNNSTTLVSVQSEPDALAANPATGKIYVANYGDKLVSIISNSGQQLLQVDYDPAAVGVNPVTNKIFVANFGSDDVSVIDGATDTLITTVKVGNGPNAIAVNQVTNRIYVANYYAGTVTMIDGNKGYATTTVTVGTYPSDIGINSVTNKIYVADYYSQEVTVIDGATNSTKNIITGDSPIALAVNVITNMIYVANYTAKGTVTVINGATGQTTSTISVGEYPKAIAVNPITDLFYVTNYYNQTVSVIDGSTAQVVQTITVGLYPTVLAINPVTDKIYVVNSYDQTVSVIGYTSTNAVEFVPVTPCRLVDTRKTGGPIPGATFRTFPVPQEGGCNIPSTAAAYSLNVTVVPPAPLGYLTIWPNGLDRPVVSTMNSLDGRIKANAAIVPAGASGAINVYVSNASDVVLDIDGYFTPAGNLTLQFYPLTPCRVLDTRNSTGDLGGPALQGKQERDFPVLESTCIPQGVGAQAYSLNFTVVPVGGLPLGYLTVWPQGQTQPLVSTLNNLTATIVANAAIVPAGTGGAIATYADQNTQLVADINGYFAAPGGQNGLDLYPAAPCRAIDTRSGGGAFSGTLKPPVDVVDSACAPPSAAQAYVFNATVVPTGGLGYLTLWPDGQTQPVVSTLNALDAAITSNMAIVPNADGSTDAYASGVTQLILDISSYFAPPPPQ